MKSIRTLLFRCVSVTVCLATANLCVPYGAAVVFGKPAMDAIYASQAAKDKAAKALGARRAKSASRALTPKEEASQQGKNGECPYLAGQNKWDVMYNGVDLVTGNYMTSVTDMSFDGGYGVPVNAFAPRFS